LDDGRKQFFHLPNRGGMHCSVVDETVLLDVWRMVGEGSCIRNSFSFSNKLSGNFHGCDLRAANIFEPSIMKKKKKTKNSGNLSCFT
jgi:hypothetical protein